MKFISSLILFGVCAIALTSGQDKDTDVHDTLEDFEKKFGQYTIDEDLAKEWEESLKKSEEEINQQNEKFNNGESTYWDELNEFSEMSEEEFEKEKTGLLPEEGNRGYAMGLLEMPESLVRELSMKNKAFFDQFESSRSNPPASVDSLANGKVTPVKNQGSCGSCAAFAAVAQAETCMLMENAPMDGLDLSEQDLVDCAYDGKSAMGCNGATISTYPDYIVDSNAGTLSHENAYPYKATRSSCSKPVKYSSGAKASKAVFTGDCGEDKLMGLVAKYGTVVTSVSAYGPLQNYGGGVFEGCKADAKRDHAVAVVGYGTDSNGVDFWNVKNSWGDHWGENGYIRIKRGINMCGIGKYCSVLDCGPPVEPGPGDFCDTNQWNNWFGGRPLNGRLNLFLNGATKQLECKEGMCKPSVEFTGHACQYICDKTNCGGAETRSLEVMLAQD